VRPFLEKTISLDFVSFPAGSKRVLHRRIRKRQIGTIDDSCFRVRLAGGTRQIEQPVDGLEDGRSALGIGSPDQLQGVPRRCRVQQQVFVAGVLGIGIGPQRRAARQPAGNEERQVLPLLGGDRPDRVVSAQHGRGGGQRALVFAKGVQHGIGHGDRQIQNRPAVAKQSGGGR